MIAGKIIILDINKDYKVWYNFLEDLKEEDLDICYTPDYLSLFTNSDVQGNLFIYKRNNNIWCLPILKKKILFDKEFSSYFDIETPYGYGGPICNTGNYDFNKDANDQFINWCKNQKVVSFLLKLNPFVFNQNKYLIKFRNFSEFDRIIVSANFEKEQNIENIIKSKVKNEINKAKKNGVSIITDINDKNFDDFRNIYLENMSDKKTSKFYFFDNNFFLKLKKLCKKYGILVISKHKKETLGASIFLNFKKRSIYFLSASKKTKFSTGIVNLMIYEACKIITKNKIKLVNFGGGRSKETNDTLYLFKKKMGNDLRKFNIVKFVNNKEIYTRILSKFKSQDPINYEKKINFLHPYN